MPTITYYLSDEKYDKLYVQARKISTTSSNMTALIVEKYLQEHSK